MTIWQPKCYKQFKLDWADNPGNKERVVKLLQCTLNNLGAYGNLTDQYMLLIHPANNILASLAAKQQNSTSRREISSDPKKKNWINLINFAMIQKPKYTANSILISHLTGNFRY